MTGLGVPEGTEGTEGTEITGQDQHGDTEVRRGSRFSIQDSCNPILKNRNIEIYQQSGRALSQHHVGLQLRTVDRSNLRNRFDFYNHCFLHNDIQAETALQRNCLVDDWQRLLGLITQRRGFEFVEQSRKIHGLE